MSGPTLGVVGSLNEDTGLRVPALPKPGETILADSRSETPGGKGANQAAAAAILGGRVAMIGAVGADDAGDRSLAALGRRGVDTGQVQRVTSRHTGNAIVVVDGTGENHIVVDPGANAALESTHVAQAVTALAPRLVLAQLEVPIACVAAAISAAREATFVLNPAPMLTDVARLREVWDGADVIVPNRAELGQLAGRPEPMGLDEVAACVAALDFVGDVVVTMGGDGVYCAPAGARHVHLPADAVDVVDTSGAGDVFCGCLGVQLASGASIVDAASVANRVAARSTTVDGAQLSSDIAW